MKKIANKFISFVFILLATQAYAATDPSDDLSRLLGDFQTLSANFNQVIYDGNKRPMQKTSGSMALSRPDKFRWEVKQLNEQLLVADGRYLWIYDIDLSQATRQIMDKNKSSSPASLLGGSVENLKSRFNVTHLSDANPSFRLVPKNKGDLFKWIELTFTNGKLARMKLSDNLGSLSVFQFSEVNLNPNLSASLFQFKAPKGVDVVQN
jgi:outer membrane lipoprotein carrier protein